jgi:hypothetical protein
MTGVSASLANLKRSYASVLAYFGEDEKMPSHAFFGTMNKFVLEFKTSTEQVEKQEKAKVHRVKFCITYDVCCLSLKC